MPGSPGIHTPQEIQELHTSESAAAINEYLSLMEDSETPRPYLIWSLIAAAAALTGQNAVFRSGVNHTIRANLFVLLLGPSALRKTSAINMTQSVIRDTSINFGPTDTGGQRHGLMSALTGIHRSDNSGYWSASGPLNRRMLHPRSASDMFLVNAELGRLMGSGSREMADFLVDLYDSSPIDYQTKAGETKISAALASVLAATTPSSLAAMLPENAVTHGIIARFLFIYEDKIYKEVPLPKEQDESWYDLREQVVSRFAWIDSNRSDFVLSDEARDSYEQVFYRYTPALEDPRLESYRGRRATTLIKVAMAIAALRNDTTIIDSDLRLAHEFLVMAEPKMHRALEYFGRNRIFQGRMLILQFLRSMGASATASKAELMAAAKSELNAKEAEEAIQGMLASGELYAYGNDDVLMLGEIKNVFLSSEHTKRKSGRQSPK